MTSVNKYPVTGQLAHPGEGTLLIRNVCPYGEGEPVDVLVRNGVIETLGADKNTSADREIDGRGNVLLPGLVDMHVHLREPGNEDAETIETGSRAAARGGFTAVFTMANTTPVTDSPMLAEAIWEKGQKCGLVDVHPVGAITEGLRGEHINEFGLMAASGARVRMFSDDGKCVQSASLMRRAAQYAQGINVLLAQHAQEATLTSDAVANEGVVAAELGLEGWPRMAEEMIVARDILIARDYGARIHICHASTAGTAELLKGAKAKGLPVSAEVTPHHLLLTDERLRDYDSVNRVNPPLRTSNDVDVLREALLDGTIDVVATDHAPHSAEFKACEFEHARPGMLGLETALAIVAELFVCSGRADWRFIAKVMSERPAEITQLPGHGRPIAEGEPANLTIVDPHAPWIVEPEDSASQSVNTPFGGMEFHTRVIATVLRGVVTFDETDN
ncbi:dihydroorotase [Corynebacterium kroppenstedtii]|uniref:dihydroorotase n=1 Tax=Corynebacterium sp. PCR 32 TaxID=3351342 RepID=UPI0030B70695